MTGTRLSQVPRVDAAAERPVALALARVNYYHSASTAGTPHEPAPGGTGLLPTGVSCGCWWKTRHHDGSG